MRLSDHPMVAIAISVLAIRFAGCAEDEGATGFSRGQAPTLELFVGQVPIASGATIEISSGYLLPGEEEARTVLQIVNTGDANLEISEILVEASPVDTFRLVAATSTSELPPGPYTIVPQEAPTGAQRSLNAQIVVKRPARGVTPEARLIIRSNSVTRGVSQPELAFPISLVVSPPKLVVVPEAIDFGIVAPGETKQASLTLDNRGGDVLIVDRVSLQGDDGFEVALGPRNFRSSGGSDSVLLDPAFELAPGKQISAPVQYAGITSEYASARLILTTNDPLATQGTPIDLEANGGILTAPTVSIEAPNGASGEVRCRLEDEASGGELLSYTWNWQIGEADAFTTFSPTLGADGVMDCDLVRCWATVSDGSAEATSNVAELVLPFGSDCDDENYCTDDSCGPRGGCLQTNNSKSCPDGDLCNGSEVCVDGQCEPGTPVDCSGTLDPCIENICNPLTGACDLAVPDETLCSDNDLCNGLEVCKLGVCVPGTETDCGGVTDPCLEKTCNPNSGLCDLPKPNGTPCGNGDLCDGVERCHDGACTEGSAIDCSGQIDPCLQKVCNPATGLCDLPMPDRTPCKDADLCNGSESCVDGHCIAGTPQDCTTVSNPCIQQVCNPQSGECDIPAPNDSPCNDGDLCNGRETCQDGTCVSGVAINCEALGETCRSCDPTTGSCSITSQDGTVCNDGDDCTSDDICVAGTCQGDLACDLCGDGELAADEACDDGNQDDTDSCSNSCTVNSALCAHAEVDGVHFIVCSDSLDNLRARSACVDLGYDELASIHSEAENTAIVDLGRANGGTEERYWIGLSDSETETQFRWYDGTPLDYQHWWQGGPSPIHSLEDCVHTHVYKVNAATLSYEGLWNDVNCADVMGYACELR